METGVGGGPVKPTLDGVLIPIVALACARQPAPSALSPTQTIALGDAAHFGPGLAQAGPTEAWFHLSRSAHVRLLFVDSESHVTALTPASTGRRVAGTHRATVAGTAVSYARTLVSERATVGPVPAAALNAPNGGWCQTAIAFARLYESSRTHWELANDGSDPITSPTHPASFNPWAGPANTCFGTVRYRRSDATGLGFESAGYWVLIVTDAPLSLARLSDVVEEVDHQALDADGLVRALPGALVAAEAPESRWAAYVLAR